VALRRGERLQSEVTTVAGEPDPESELVGCIDRIHEAPLWVRSLFSTPLAMPLAILTQWLVYSFSLGEF